MKAIEARGLAKRYGDVTAVRELSFAVEQGELFSLLGVNGAGKTTAIRMLTGLTRPDAGDALLMGRSLKADLRGVKEVVAVSPQESAVAPRLTVSENLDLVARLHGANRAQARERLEAALGRFGLSEVRRRRAGALSGGWQRRLSIAMALISEPQVLFLDEPTLGLDVLARRGLWQLIGELKGKTAILLTTHSMEEAEALSDRIGIMNGGRLAAVGTPGELMTQAGATRFEDAFVALAAHGEVEQ